MVTRRSIIILIFHNFLALLCQLQLFPFFNPASAAASLWKWPLKNCVSSSPYHLWTLLTKILTETRKTVSHFLFWGTSLPHLNTRVMLQMNWMGGLKKLNQNKHKLWLWPTVSNSLTKSKCPCHHVFYWMNTFLKKRKFSKTKLYHRQYHFICEGKVKT